MPVIDPLHPGEVLALRAGSGLELLGQLLVVVAREEGARQADALVVTHPPPCARPSLRLRTRSPWHAQGEGCPGQCGQQRQAGGTPKGHSRPTTRTEAPGL